MDIENAFLNLARLSLDGKTSDSMALVKQVARNLTKSRPDLIGQIDEIIKKTSTRGSPTRATPPIPDIIPVDTDTRLELVKKEFPVYLDFSPVWAPEVSKHLYATVEERKLEKELEKAGLSPTRSMLLVGAPGVGKTLSARWLAMKLGRPLFVLDLAAVMSSYLGKTGNNIRSVLSFAQKTPSILLLDEFDAIAKRRDDNTELGELKRLVTVLLQAVDEWPSDGLLLAATNHPELLDPAIWRRFDRVVEFPKPSVSQKEEYLLQILGKHKISSKFIEALSYVFSEMSYAEIEKQVHTALRENIISRNSLEESLINVLASHTFKLSKEEKLKIAHFLDGQSFSKRKIHELTGLSRDTIRKYPAPPKKKGDKE